MAFITLILLNILSFTTNGMGGEWIDAKWKDYPFMALLAVQRGTGYFICGGSIIATHEYNGKGVILTAAHCAQDANNIMVMVGCTTSNCYNDVGAETYHDDYYVIHPEYRHSLKSSHVDWSNNDIALIFLKEAITVPGAKKIELHSDISVLENNAPIQVFGYYGSCGNTKSCKGGSDVDTLEYANTNFMIADECDNIWGKAVAGLHDFCVLDDKKKDGLQGVCMGDSGSPLVFKGMQIGLNSWGPSTCDPTMPSVATSIPNYYEWVASQCPECVGRGMCCIAASSNKKYIKSCPKQTTQINCGKAKDGKGNPRCSWISCGNIGECKWIGGNKGSQKKCSAFINANDCNTQKTCDWSGIAKTEKILAIEQKSSNNEVNAFYIWITLFVSAALFTICTCYYCYSKRKGETVDRIDTNIVDSTTPLITVVDE